MRFFTLIVFTLASLTYGAKLTKIPGIDANAWYESTGKRTWDSADVSRKISGNFYRKYRNWNNKYNKDRVAGEDPIRFKSFE